jgi:ectoine hydroxylase-related dioxygenase (phytanoyl-CoA dioxygenase family)
VEHNAVRCAVTNFRDRGFAIAELMLSAVQCDHIALSIPAIPTGRGGVRDLIDHPTVLQVLKHRDLAKYLWSEVGRELVAVKATLFDKSLESNWRVTWHQDRTIAVRERLDVEGFTAWSVKAGVDHVQAPAHVLEQMLVLRIYLDDCGPENGPLHLIPGSHELGKVDEREISRIVATQEAFELCVPKGAIVIMRPLLLHSSPSARAASHRRVLHIEFGPAEAISPLQWEQSVRLPSAA